MDKIINKEYDKATDEGFRTPSYFQKAISLIAAMHEKKKKDYTAAHREFGNFEDAAKHAGITTAQAIENLIGTKEARRQNLEHGNLKPVNESIEDTLLDRAVYSLIRYAHYLKEKDEQNERQAKQFYDTPKPSVGLGQTFGDKFERDITGINVR